MAAVLLPFLSEEKKLGGERVCFSSQIQGTVCHSREAGKASRDSKQLGQSHPCSSSEKMSANMLSSHAWLISVCLYGPGPKPKNNAAHSELGLPITMKTVRTTPADISAG